MTLTQPDRLSQCPSTTVFLRTTLTLKRWGEEWRTKRPGWRFWNEVRFVAQDRRWRSKMLKHNVSCSWQELEKWQAWPLPARKATRKTTTIFVYLPVPLDLLSGRRLNMSSIRRVDRDERHDSSSILATAAWTQLLSRLTMSTLSIKVSPGERSVASISTSVPSSSTSSTSMSSARVVLGATSNSSLTERSTMNCMAGICPVGGRSSSIWTDTHRPPWKPANVWQPPTRRGSWMIRTMCANDEGSCPTLSAKSCSAVVLCSTSRWRAQGIKLQFRSPASHWTISSPSLPPSFAKKSLKRHIYILYKIWSTIPTIFTRTTRQEQVGKTCLIAYRLIRPAATSSFHTMKRLQVSTNRVAPSTLLKLDFRNTTQISIYTSGWKVAMWWKSVASKDATQNEKTKFRANYLRDDWTTTSEWHVHEKMDLVHDSWRCANVSSRNDYENKLSHQFIPHRWAELLFGVKLL